MDIICTLADPGSINGWGKAGLGLDGAIDHRLGLLEKAQIGGRGRTAMARGVPLEAEPGYTCYLKGVCSTGISQTDRGDIAKGNLYQVSIE